MADSTLPLKAYQRDALDAVRDWLNETVLTDDADTAFYRRTKRPYQQVEGLPGVPYVCLRLPTGGGKTLIAAHAVGLVADAFLKTDTPCALWLVPSNAIREQTISALTNRSHPYRRALAERFGENVRVIGVAEALYAKRPDYDAGAIIIVATIQSFRVDKIEGRKVYEQNGELMDHFSGLSESQLQRLESGDGLKTIYSLCNVLKLRRPMVVVDEAHNARTPLSFTTLARLDPSIILELTATPAVDSNVLYHVSAAELKAEDMIKLPIILRGHADWKVVMQEAKAWLDHLAECARAEAPGTERRVRPIMLVQAQPDRVGTASITPEVLKKALIEDFLVPQNEIKIATSAKWELDGVDLASEACPVRFVITVQALREGWDCPNAYVLCSVAEQHGAAAVEQILGRVMRLPYAKRATNPDLNQAYAFSATTSFANTARSLVEGLVANGFERIEAAALIRPPRGLPMFEQEVAPSFESEKIDSRVNLTPLSKALSASTDGRVTVDPSSRRIVSKGYLSAADAAKLTAAAPKALAKIVKGLVDRAKQPAKAATPQNEFRVPHLAVMRSKQLQIFGREHFLDVPWQIEQCDPAAINEVFAPPTAQGEEAHLDVSSRGKIDITFVADLHNQLSLGLGDRGWDYQSLVRWLDRHLAPAKQRDITQASAQRFIRGALDSLKAHNGHEVKQLALWRFRLVDALGTLVERYRKERADAAFRSCLFGNSLEFRTSSKLATAFVSDNYWPKTRYEGRFSKSFSKHLKPEIIGEMNGEEEMCALALDQHPKIKCWVRNLERQPQSFRLATSSDWFYPDFAAELNDGRKLVVEYKGGQLATSQDTDEKELVGVKWAAASEGTCVFLMVKDRDYGAITRLLA